jgi:hypothetical protein
MKRFAFGRLVPAVLLLVLVAALLPVSACKTLSGQEMAYLGDDTAKPNVSGKGTHGDWMGIGVGAQTYIREYEQAILDAKGGNPNFSLTNIKAFKEQKSWPQVVGIFAAAAGAGITAAGIVGGSTGGSIGGALLYIGGMALTGYRTYDYWVIAEVGN